MFNILSQIYDTKPWRRTNDSLTPDVFYTASKDNNNIYAIFLKWPKDEMLGMRF
jgi:hypothetical protein